MRLTNLVFVGAIVVSTAMPAQADQHIKLKYFDVTGKSSAEIVKSLLRRAPRVGGIRAYGTTKPRFRQKGNLFSNGKSCKVRDFSVTSTFEIELPKLRNEKYLSERARPAWDEFVEFVKIHEYQHTIVFDQCVCNFVNEVKKFEARTCRTVERRISRLLRQSLEKCQKQHEAIDDRDQQELLRQPLVRQAIAARAVVMNGSKRKKLRVTTPAPQPSEVLRAVRDRSCPSPS